MCGRWSKITDVDEMSLYVKVEMGEEVLGHGRHNADMGSSEIGVSNGGQIWHLDEQLLQWK